MVIPSDNFTNPRNVMCNRDDCDSAQRSPDARSLPHVVNVGHRTHFLTGLKGICALLVLITHHEHWGRSSYESTLLERSYGYKEHYYFATLPYIRTIFSGAHFSVAVFFTISGYVLSLQPLLLIRSNQQSGLARCIGSAIFRRWLRLLLPVIGTTIAFLTLWHVFAIDVPYMERQSSYHRDLELFAGEIGEFAWLFARDASPTGYGPIFSYNDHLWSIPLELKGSTIVFLGVLVTNTMTYKRRLTCYLTLIIYLIYLVDGWYGAMFVTGMFICDADLECSGQTSPDWWRMIVPGAAFALGMYLAGVPHTPDVVSLSANPGWYWLSTLKPRSMLDMKWFYLFLASGLVIWSIPRLPLVKSFLESRACQTLGKLSYSVYLVHGPILWTIGDHLYMLSHVYIGKLWATPDSWILDTSEEPRLLGFELAFLIPCLVLVILTLLVAQLHRLVIDVPSRKLSDKFCSVILHNREEADTKVERI